MSWEVVADNSTGDPHNSPILFNGEIYVLNNAGLMFKWDGASVFLSVTGTLAGDFIISLIVFDEKIFGGTNLGKLLEWDLGIGWIERAPVLVSNRTVEFVINSSELFAIMGAGNLYKWDGVNIWINVASPLALSTNLDSVVLFNSKIYAGTSVQSGQPGGELLEWDDISIWVKVASQILSIRNIFSMIDFGSELYGACRDGHFIKWNGTTAWISIIDTERGSLKDFLIFESNLHILEENGALLRWDGATSLDVLAPSLGFPNDDSSDLLQFGTDIFSTSGIAGE